MPRDRGLPPFVEKSTEPISVTSPFTTDTDLIWIGQMALAASAQQQHLCGMLQELTVNQSIFSSLGVSAIGTCLKHMHGLGCFQQHSTRDADPEG